MVITPLTSVIVNDGEIYSKNCNGLPVPVSTEMLTLPLSSSDVQLLAGDQSMADWPRCFGEKRFISPV